MKDFDVQPTISWDLWNSLSLLTFTMNIRRWPDPHDDDKRNLPSSKCRMFTIIEDLKVSIGQFNELGGYILNLKLFSIKNKFWTTNDRLNPNFQISRFSQTLFDVGFVIYWGESDSERYWCWKLQLTTDEMLQCYAAEQIFIYLRRGSVHKTKVCLYFIIQLPL